MKCNPNLAPGFDPVAAGYDNPSEEQVVEWAIKKQGKFLRAVLVTLKGEGEELALALGRIITGESVASDESLVVRASHTVASHYPVEFAQYFARGRRG